MCRGQEWKLRREIFKESRRKIGHETSLVAQPAIEVSQAWHCLRIGMRTHAWAKSEGKNLEEHLSSMVRWLNVIQAQSILSLGAV